MDVTKHEKKKKTDFNHNIQTTTLHLQQQTSYDERNGNFLGVSSFFPLPIYNYTRALFSNRSLKFVQRSFLFQNEQIL